MLSGTLAFLQASQKLEEAPEAQRVNAWPTLALQGPTPSYYPSTSPAQSWANSYSWSGPGRSNKGAHCVPQILLAASLPRKNLSESPAETRVRGCRHLCCPWRRQGGAQDSIQGEKVGVLAAAMTSCLWGRGKDSVAGRTAY